MREALETYRKVLAISYRANSDMGIALGLHIGAHGNFYPENAMESAVVLSANAEDEKAVRSPASVAPRQQVATVDTWTAMDMAAADLGHIQLVSLSSCETGLTDQNLDRDVFGIVRALMFAGVDSVVAPLWSVQDEATAILISDFHAQFAKKLPASDWQSPPFRCLEWPSARVRLRRLPRQSPPLKLRRKRRLLLRWRKRSPR